MKSRNRGITLSYLNTVVGMVCGLFLSSFLLRCLGDTEYGVYQTISSFVNYLVLLEFGVGTVMTRNISMCRSKNAGTEELEANIATLWVTTNVLALVILAMAAVFYISLDEIYAGSLTAEQIRYGKKIFILVTANLILSFYIQTFKGMALGYEKYSFSATLSVVRTVIRTATLAVLITCFRHSIIVAAVDTALSLLMLIYSWCYCRKQFHVRFQFRAFDRSVFRQTFPICFAIFLQAIVNQANGNVDKFLIGIKLTPELVSLYSVALYVYSVFSTITTVPISMYAPQVAKEISNGITGQELTKRLSSAARLTSLIGGTILFGFIAVGRQFVVIFYGVRYTQAWFIAMALMSAMYLDAIVGVLENVLDVYNKRLIRSYTLAITTILNIVLTFFWLEKWGIFGAVAATCICTLLGQVTLMGIYYTRVIKIRVLYLYKEAFRGILPAQVVSALAALLLGTQLKNTYLSFVVCGVLYVLLFATFYLAVDGDIRRKLLRKLRRK